MNYFDHEFISNSNITEFLTAIGLKREMPANIQQIFSFGTEFHASILQPHLNDWSKVKPEEKDLICRMRDTFWEDSMCRNFMNDCEREKEFYGRLCVGGMEIKSRCKADAARAPLKYLLELKGVKVTSQKQFIESLVALDYDRAVPHYQLTSGYEWTLLVGISKVNPKMLFKKLVRRHDAFYAEGEEKLRQALIHLYQYSPDDVKLVA